MSNTQMMSLVELQSAVRHIEKLQAARYEVCVARAHLGTLAAKGGMKGLEVPLGKLNAAIARLDSDIEAAEAQLAR